MKSFALIFIIASLNASGRCEDFGGIGDHAFVASSDAGEKIKARRPSSGKIQLSKLSDILGARAAKLRSGVEPSFERLPADPHYRAGATGKRYRAAARIEVTPDPSSPSGAKIRSYPGASYEEGSTEARYAGIEPTVLQDPDFQKLVLGLIARLPGGAPKQGVQIGLHQIRVADGEVTPDGLHQDDFTDAIAIWVVARKNIVGGQTQLAKDASGSAMVLERTLVSGELIVFDNKALWHGVLPIARKDPAIAGTRDVFVFSFAPLKATASSLSAEAESAAIAAGRRELMKPSPDVSLLRGLHQSGSARVQAGLLRSFKAWSRYYSKGGAQGQEEWGFIKSAAAPWAGRVYVRKLEVHIQSFMELMQQQQMNEKDAHQEAQKIHQADLDFSQEFIKAAESQAPQGLDAEEAAAQISDAVLYPHVIERVLQRRQRGKFDRSSLRSEMARTIKDTVYLYSPEMTVEKIEALLGSGPVMEKLEGFLEMVEEYVPNDPGPAAAQAQSLPSQTTTPAQKTQQKGGR